MTDNVLWCVRCGHYASSFAVGLARPCTGGPSSDGTRSCRNKLSRFTHPKTNLPLAPPHFPESTLARQHLAAQHDSIAWGAKRRHHSRCAAPSATLLPALAPLASRLAHATAASATSARRPPLDPLAPPPLIRRRLRGKQPPCTTAVPLLPAASFSDELPPSPTACATSPQAAALRDPTTHTHGIRSAASVSLPVCTSDAGSLLASASCTCKSEFVEATTHQLQGGVCNGALSCSGLRAAACMHRDRVPQWVDAAQRFPQRKRPLAETQRAALLRQLRTTAYGRQRPSDEEPSVAAAMSSDCAMILGSDHTRNLRQRTT